MRSLLGPAACLLGALIPACNSSDNQASADLGGLVKAQEKPPQPIDVDAAAKSAQELLRAASVAHRLVGERLGPHRFRGSDELRVLKGDDEVEKLDDETRIDFDGKNFHAVLENSEDYGRDAYFVNGTLYLRPRFGKYHRRSPEKPEEPAQIRNEIYGTLGAYFELLAPGAEVSDGGAIQVGGRSARKIELGKASEPREPPEEALSQREWRESAVVRDVSGYIALDEETGVPLKAEVQGAIGFQRDGQSFVMKLSVTHEINSVGAVDDVKAPPKENTVATPRRATEVQEREKLLKGIAPPARKPPTPATVERHHSG